MAATVALTMAESFVFAKSPRRAEKTIMGVALDQGGGLNAECLRNPPQYRNARRFARPLDRADVPRAETGAVRQFFLRHLLVMADATQIDRHDLLEVHGGTRTSVGTIVLGTIVPIRTHV
jgi:hypothetical protein